MLAACGEPQPAAVAQLAQNARHEGTWHVFPAASPGGAEGIVRLTSGDFWVANSEGTTLSRFSPDGSQKVFEIGWSPVAMTADRSGVLWFTNPRLLETIVSFNPKTQKVASVALSDDADGGIALGEDGNIWVLQTAHLAKVTPAGKFTEYATPYTFAGSGLAWANGRMWFLAGNGFASLNPANGRVATYQASFGNVGGMVATGGSLYVMAGDLFRFELRTKTVTKYAIPRRFLGAPSPQSLALAPDGSLWYAAQRLNRRRARVVGGGFVRFDPSTRRFTTYPSPDHANWNWGITVAPAGNVWGTAGDSLTVLDP